MVERRKTHIFRTQGADVPRLCVRKRQVSVKKLMKHYCANVVELIFKIAIF